MDLHIPVLSLPCPPSSCCHFYIHSRRHHLRHSSRFPELSCWSCSVGQLGDLQLRICGIRDWICLWGPDIMTGVRRHLLKCKTGLPCFDGVIPSFHFSADFSSNCAGQAKGHRETSHSLSGMPLMACQSLHLWLARCFISWDSCVPTYWCQL